MRMKNEREINKKGMFIYTTNLNRNKGGENTSYQFSFSPDNNTKTCNSCYDKMRRGLAKDFNSSQESHARSYDENLL